VPEHPARKRQFQRRRDYRALHSAGTCALRHAYADLRRLARNRIGDDAVDAERRQSQAQSSKRGHQEHEEAARRNQRGRR
jgi:hypothetical protein